MDSSQILPSNVNNPPFQKKNNMLILRTFSDKRHRKSLKEVDGNKGIKRTWLSVGLTNGGSLAGRIKGEEEADKADEEGASDVEILRRAGSAGGKRGAIVGSAVGALGGAALGAMVGGKRAAANSIYHAATGATSGAMLGYLGGRNSARVQTRDRLRKRSGSV